MRKTILYLSGFMIISSLSVSCVSKKKFEELARAKREVDRNLLDLKRDKKQLEDQLQLAKDDFNTIRYKLTENNAVKDKTIDQLYTKLRSLESKQVELKSELSNVADQIKTTTQSTSEQISSLESSLQKVSNERDQLRRQLTEVQTNLEFENQKIKAQLESATNNLQAQNGEVEKLKADMASSWHLGDKPFATWALSNNSAEIRRVKDRIKSLSQQKEIGFVGWEFDGGKVEANTEANRLQIFFEDKSDEATREALKSNGFRWSPKAGAWQRQLTSNAYYAADYVKAIAPLTGEKPTEIQRAHIRAQKVTAQEQPTQEQPENYLKAAEQTTEQNYNMIDGQINNTPTAAELEEKAKAGGQISLAEYAEALKAEKKQAEPEKKSSIRAQLKAAKEQTPKKQARQKTQDLERS